jgi:hypothetical protein
MSVTKAATTFTWASGSSTASGTTNPISTATHNADTIYGQLVQVGTATTAATIQVQESPDGSTYWSPPTKLITFPLAAGTYPFQIAVDLTAQDVQVVYTAQAGGTSSTLTMQLGSASE